MKIILFFILSTLVISCASHGSKKEVAIETNISVEILTCPEKGTCTLELMANKSITFKKDDFDIVYPVITDGEKTVLKYTYNKNTSPKYQDGYYTEIVYAEFDPVLQNITLENAELEPFKFHFGRLCFCKGQTGYYPIKRGNFTLVKKGSDSIQIDLDFEVKQVPQIVNRISEIISVKSN
jgi:hypothetical protein